MEIILWILGGGLVLGIFHALQQHELSKLGAPSGPPPPDPRHEAMPVFVALAPTLDYEFRVVGESFTQDALERLAGPPTEDGVEADFPAALKFEDSNAFDPMAVAVFIDNERVGYLPRLEARKYRQACAQLAVGEVVGLCHARVRGGWTRRSGVGLFGVTLNIAWPPRFIS